MGFLGKSYFAEDLTMKIVTGKTKDDFDKSFIFLSYYFDLNSLISPELVRCRF